MSKQSTDRSNNAPLTIGVPKPMIKARKIWYRSIEKFIRFANPNCETHNRSVFLEQGLQQTLIYKETLESLAQTLTNFPVSTKLVEIELKLVEGTLGLIQSLQGDHLHQESGIAPFLLPWLPDEFHDTSDDVDYWKSLNPEPKKKPEAPPTEKKLATKVFNFRQTVSQNLDRMLTSKAFAWAGLDGQTRELKRGAKRGKFLTDRQTKVYDSVMHAWFHLSEHCENESSKILNMPSHND